MLLFFFFKQKTAYEVRISDWSSDVCSSDLQFFRLGPLERDAARHGVAHRPGYGQAGGRSGRRIARAAESVGFASDQPPLGQIGQFQIVKKEVQKLLTRQNEPDFIHSFARTPLATCRSEERSVGQGGGRPSRISWWP